MSRSSADRVTRAEQAARRARNNLGETLDELQQQLSPSNLVNEAVQEVRLRGRGLADLAVAQMVSRPVATTLVASLLGVVFKGRPTVQFLINLILGSRATSGRSRHS